MEAKIDLPTLDVGEFDPTTDSIMIEETRYSGCLFREGFGLKAMIGQVLRIENHVNGVVTVTRLREFEVPPVLSLADQQLHADAERYRWLRKQHWSDSQLAVVSSPKENVRLGTYCPSEGLLDAAIDEIMESNSTKNGVSA